MAQHRRKLTMYSPAVFRIRVQGVLDASWSEYFGTQAMSVEEDEAGFPVTTFASEPVDQAALVGIVNYLNALGLPLKSIEHIQPQDQKGGG